MRCQKEQECSFWVFHKPIGTCYLQAWKETTLHDNEYLSGPKYCDCYVEENQIFDEPASFSFEKNLEDCRSFLNPYMNGYKNIPKYEKLFQE